MNAVLRSILTLLLLCAFPASPHAGVTLAPEAAAEAGIATTKAVAADAPELVEGFGRMLDPLPLIEALHARNAARSSAEAAGSEYERVRRLQGAEQNASLRDVETARVALARAEAELTTASARVTLAWGAVFDEPAGIADDVAAGRAGVLRIDLPAGEHLTATPASAMITPVGDPAHSRRARVLGTARTTDPLLQSEAYVALVADDPPAPGTSLVTTVQRAATPVHGVAVPLSALLWLDGRAVVYVAVRPGGYEQRVLTLGPRLGAGWLATDGVAAGEEVVTRGAGQLLSTETIGTEPAEPAD